MKVLLSFAILVGFLTLACRGVGTANSKDTPPIPGEEALLQGNLDLALDELEKQVAVEPENGRAWRLLGEAQLRLAQEAIEKGSTSLFVGAALQDAGQAFLQAESLLQDDPKTAALRARIEFLNGESEKAYDLATEAKKRLGNSTSPKLRYAVEKIVAEASFQRYLALRQSGAPVEEISIPFSRTFRALQACESLHPEDAWAYEKQTDLFLWEEAKIGAVDALKRGIEKIPSETNLHSRLQNLYSANQNLPALIPLYEEFVSKKPEDATTIWYQGLAYFLNGDASRRQAETQKAAESYKKSKDAFSKSIELREDFQESVSFYLGLADISLGWCHFENRQIAEAAAIWTSALQSQPNLKDVPDGLGQTAKQGLGLIGAEYVKGREFERGKTLFKTLSETNPKDPDWMNNYAFLSRESGTQAQAAGKAEEANEFFEESYSAYRRAVDLTPEDPRTINDCALILLYHLDRELDKAEKMFRRAASLGEESLKSTSLGTAEIEELYSVIGDAYQNLGVLYFGKKGDPLGARRFFRKSLQVSSVSRPPVIWHINRINQMESLVRDWTRLWFPTLAPLFSTPEATEKTRDLPGRFETLEYGKDFQRVNELITSRQINDALDLLDEVDKKSPDLSDTNFLYGKTYLLKAETFLKQGVSSMNVSWAFMDAEKFLRRATEQSPNHGEAFLLLGRALLANNDHEKAAATAERAAALMPRNSEAFLLKGKIAFQRYLEARKAKDEKAKEGYVQTAKESLEKAAQLSPNLANPRSKLADLFAWEGNEDEAKANYSIALGLEPTSHLAERILEMYGPEKGLNIFEEAMAKSKKIRKDQDPKNGLLHWYLGYIHFQLNQSTEAEEAFQKALSLDPDSLNSHYYLGKIYYGRKDYPQAAKAFAAYAARDLEGFVGTIQLYNPNPESFLAILDFLEAEAMKENLKEIGRELAHVNALLEPAKAIRWNNYAFLCRETKKYEDSYSAYLQAVELEPDNPQLLNDCALILQYHLGRDLDKARKMYEKAIEKAEVALADPQAASQTKEEAQAALRDAKNNLQLLKSQTKQ